MTPTGPWTPEDREAVMDALRTDPPMPEPRRTREADAVLAALTPRIEQIEEAAYRKGCKETYDAWMATQR